MSEMLAGLRQLRYPREIRISPVAWPEDVAASLQQVAELVDRLAQPEPPGEAGHEEQCRFLAQTGTGLWRLRQNMLRPGSDQPHEEMRRPFRHLQSVLDVLAAEGVTIQDHTDSLFDSGMSLQVIAFQPTPGIERERVAETIKPTIYLDGRMIQMGEVIVATPESETSPED